MTSLSNSPSLLIKKSGSAPLLVILSNPAPIGGNAFNFASNQSALLSGGGIQVATGSITTQFEVTDELWAIATPPASTALVELVVQ